MTQYQLSKKHRLDFSGCLTTFYQKLVLHRKGKNYALVLLATIP
jgi:hypothetical protein